MNKLLLLSIIIIFIMITSGLFAQGFNYGEALQKVLYFYDAQRAGPLPGNNEIIWRGDACLNDGADNGVDLTGGWLDAGDHVKFGLPMASTAVTLGWAVYEYRTAFEAAGLLPRAMETIKWATDYFIKAHTAPNEFYYQVGDGGSDHAWWGPVEVVEMVMSRPSYKVTLSSPGSAVTGASAAALAIASIIFETDDPSYASLCLQHAEQLYSFANSTQSDSGYTAANGYYTSYSGYWDELSAAATWLYLKTGNTTYLTGAENAAQNWVTEGRGTEWEYTWTHSWDDMHYMTQILLAEITGKQVYIDSVERNLDYWLPGGGITYSPGGLAWLDQWGSLRYAANAALLACIWANAGPGDPAKKALYSDFAQNQINYILGSNPAGRSFEIGFGVNPPINPHHRTAHGAWYNDINDPPDNRHILFGALVGGPSSNDSYTDDRTDYQQNEVACDYNAGFAGALAWMYSIHGGSILPDFPAQYFKPEHLRYPEYFVRAKINSETATSCQIVTQTTNRSAWPASIKDSLSIKYFFDITEAVNAGFSINDITVESGTNEGGTLSGPFPWSGNIYSINIDWTGIPIYPGGRSECERLCIFQITGPSDTAWDTSNDWSFSGLAGSPFTWEPTDLTGYTEYIPLYDNGILLAGEEPPVSPTEEPTPEPTPSPTPTPFPTGEQDVENKATADFSTTAGSIAAGSYTDTHTLNGINEELRESESGGRPSTRYSQLNHTWSFEVAYGTGYTFYINAYHTANGEGDDFTFSYSMDNGSYTPMLSVTKTVNDGIYQSCVFPGDVGGILYIQVQDTDRTQGMRTLDSLYVDHMYILTTDSTGTPEPTPELTPEPTPETTPEPEPTKKPKPTQRP